MKKTFPLVLLVLVFSTCKKDRPVKLDFARKSMTEKDFSACENLVCPEIKISYLDFGKTGISKKIGKTMDDQRAMIIEVSDEEIPKAVSLKAAVENFIGEFQGFREEYPDFEAGYEIRMNESIVNRTDEILVIRTRYYIYTGGAHGYGATNFNTFSLENGKLLGPEELFSDFEAFKTYAEMEFRKKYNIPENENINSTGFFFEDDVFALPENIAILEDAVVLVYNAYEAAAYANGEMVLRFPKSEVSQWLRF